jgi:hypothetical protein
MISGVLESPSGMDSPGEMVWAVAFTWSRYHCLIPQIDDLYTFRTSTRFIRRESMGALCESTMFTI